MAKEKGLEPLAAYLLSLPQQGIPVEEAAQYINEEKGVTSPEEALQGSNGYCCRDCLR